MATTIQARIVPIGNSQGIRLPKVVLEQSGLSDEVELEVDRHRIVIQPARRPREGWGEAFQTLAERGEDVLLDAEETGTTEWDQEEWEWFPTRVACEFEGKKGQIVLDQVRTVDKSRFVRVLGKVSERTGKEALAVLQEMFTL